MGEPADETTRRWVIEVPAGPHQGMTVDDIVRVAIGAGGHVAYPIEAHPLGFVRIKVRFPDATSSKIGGGKIALAFIPNRALFWSSPGP